MNLQEIKKVLQDTKDCFFKNDIVLLSIEANERSLTHKFAEHLQFIIGDGWKVDCEYNRYGDKPKTLDEIKSIIGISTATDEIKSKTVYPDIVVHKRGKTGRNLLVIEAKKDPTLKEKKIDIIKLKKIQEKYTYDFAVFLIFDIKKAKIRFKFV